MYKLLISYLYLFILFVQFNDSRVITDPPKGEADLIVGGPLKIGCKYESSSSTPNRIIEWQKGSRVIKKAKEDDANEDTEEDDDDKNYEMDGNQLKIKNGRRIIDEGEYRCVFKNKAIGNISVTAKPLLERLHPIGAVIDGKSINIEEDLTLKLQCTANSTLPLEFMWFKINNITNTKNNAHNYFDDDKYNVTDSMSTLTLSNLKREDRAYYGCEVRDKRNRSVIAVVLVRVKSKYAALWPFFGILGEVVILCTVIFIYEKRRQKPDFSDSSDTANESHSPLAQSSSKSQDIRQRK